MCKRALTCGCLAALLVLVGCGSTSPTPQPAAPRTSARDPLAPTSLMIEGQGLLSQGKIAEGIAKYQAALALQPTNPVIHNLIGIAELQRGDLVKALTAFSRALELVPGYSDARNNRGTTYVQLGQFALAEADFLAVLSDMTYANRTGVLFNLGSLYLGRGNLAAAEENLRKAATPAGPVEAFVLLAQVEERLGKGEQAEMAYRAAMSHAPERLDVPLRLAQLLESQGRSPEARELYQRVIELGPDSPEAAQARQRLGR